MNLDLDVRPMVRPPAPRRFPVAFQDKVKQELDAMVTKGVIAPVTEPSEWVSQMVVTQKKILTQFEFALTRKTSMKLYKENTTL